MPKKLKDMAKHKLKAALREVFKNPPSTVRRASVKGKARRKMLIAVAFAKARKAGERLPKKRKRAK